MREVNITELRSHLPAYLRQVQRGEELRITSRGKAVARLVPERDERARAKAALEALRDRAWVGDVVSPVDIDWDAGR